MLVNMLDIFEDMLMKIEKVLLLTVVVPDNVGLVFNTTEHVPVYDVIPVPPLKIARVPLVAFNAVMLALIII
jgi:hypothetical protein